MAGTSDACHVRSRATPSTRSLADANMPRASSHRFRMRRARLAPPAFCNSPLLHDAMPTTSPQFAPLAQLAADLRAGRTTSRALVEKALERIADPSGQGSTAFISVDADHARAAADAHDALRRAGTALSPLAGIPVSIKDLFDIEGQVTRAGSRALADSPPAKADAPSVARLRRAGAVIVGRTNMSEFAFSGLGLNPHYGTPRSPWRAHVPGDARIAGGSSSGAAASVADGMAAIALGTDTGGSIRIPAALCGLSGFKPTASRIPRQGGVPLSKTLDSFGPIGVSVACCALVDRILAGREPDVPASRPLEGVRLGVLTHYVTDGVETPVANAVSAAINHLAAAGALVEDVRFAPLDRLPEISRFPLVAIEAYAWHRKLMAERGAQYDPRVLGRLKRAESASAADYIELCEARAAMIEAARTTLWQRFDAIVCPTVPVVPPRIAELEQDDDLFLRTNALILRNPTAFNFLDACALSLPCHPRGEAPVGLMLAGAPNNDDTLLSIGRAVEAVLETTR
jgi:aspartyl-tRNA(Asn)/glutamyl-tRNA(Gln) amidotransferase subunit A